MKFKKQKQTHVVEINRRLRERENEIELLKGMIEGSK